MNLINPVSFSAAQNYSNRALKSNLKQSSVSQINNAINFGSASAQVIKSPVTQKLAASAVAMVAGLAGLAAVSAKDLITKNQTDETANTPNNNTTTNVENASQNKPNNVNAPIKEENNSTKPNSEKEIRITKEDLIQELKKGPSIEEIDKKRKEGRIQREKELAKEAKRIAIMEKADEIRDEVLYRLDLAEVTMYNTLTRLLKFLGKKDV